MPFDYEPTYLRSSCSASAPSDRTARYGRIVSCERNLPFVKFILSTFMGFEWNVLIPITHTLTANRVRMGFRMLTSPFRPPPTCDERPIKQRTRKIHSTTTTMTTTMVAMTAMAATAAATTKRQNGTRFLSLLFFDAKTQNARLASRTYPSLSLRADACPICMLFVFHLLGSELRNGIVLLVMFYNDVRQLMNFT